MDTYHQIKKQNGEAFAKAIRDFHDGIFEIPHIVDIVRFAGRDAKPILLYLASLTTKKTEKNQSIYEDPITLLKKAHYDAYYVTNLEEQNAIEKYFTDDEKLCTFTDPKRYQDNYIINCIKENVKEIKKTSPPKREDEYGVSVLSIQISKKTKTVSIICRHNHNVLYPNNTFNSNLDNIIPGLSASVQRHFNINFNGNQFSILPRGYTLIGNRIVCYSTEVNNTYLGQDFYVKNGTVVPLNKDYQIMLEECILNLKDRTVTDLIDNKTFPIDETSFENKYNLCNVLVNELKGKKLSIRKEKGMHQVYADNTFIALVKGQSIIKLHLPNTKEIGNFVLRDNQELNQLIAPNLERVGKCFLYHNYALQGLYLPKLKFADECFLCNNERLEIINTPELEEVGENFLLSNNLLKKASFPNLKKVSAGFLSHNRVLGSLELPQLEYAGDAFLQYNLSLKELILPNLKELGYGCLLCNENFESFYAPKLQNVKHDFYYCYASKFLEEKQYV